MQNREEKERIGLVSKQQRFWISLVFFYKCVDQIKKVINSGRSEKLEKIQSKILSRLSKKSTKSILILRKFSQKTKLHLNTILQKFSQNKNF